MTEPTLSDSFPNQTLSDTHTNLKSLIVQKLSRTTSEISPLKLIHSATLPSKKFINLQRTASTGINQAQVASNLISVDQSDDSLKVTKGNRMKRSMSSTMSHFKNRSSTMSPDSPLLNQAHSRSPNKKRNLTSAIKILPTTMNESRLSARGSPYKGSPLAGSPSNKSKDEATSAAVMKVQEIITGCSKLTQESPRSPVRVKAKVKEEEEEQKTGTRFDFWKKDETFLEERAKMRAELDKHKEKTLPREKGWELLEEGKKNNNIDEEEEEKERYINEKERLGQNNEMMKFILQKPRTFCVKTIPAATKKALRLQQGLLHPVENKITEEDRSAEKTEPDQGKMVPRAMTASPGLRRDEEKVQTNEKKLRSTMRERSNDSGFIRPDELEGASSSLLIRKVSELQKQPSRSVERSQGKFGRVKSELLKKPSVILEEKLTRWNEKIEVSPKQMTSFLAHKRGDYRKRVMPIHQLYKSSSLMKMLTG